MSSVTLEMSNVGHLDLLIYFECQTAKKTMCRMNTMFQGRVSLRIGTGKRGRQAAIRQRRGSLKRKDRSAEKALKEERALERRTVVLPG